MTIMYILNRMNCVIFFFVYFYEQAQAQAQNIDHFYILSTTSTVRIEEEEG
jgi:hypothetical protein